MAGYSGTPLPKKLGIKPGHVVVRLKRATDIDLGDLPESVELRTSLRGSKPLDLVMLLTDRASEMTELATRVEPRLAAAGMLWLGWPKKASGVPTDLSDGRVREIGLGLGLVDNKTCAIDDVWSGLRFVRRLRDR